MALLKIRRYPDPVLKLKALPLKDFGPAEQKLFDDMIETMHAADGVGLAAPQVGVSKRILIACPAIKRGEEYVIVNPQIVSSSGREVGVEGCLSLPGLSSEIARAKKVTLRYLDRRGAPQEIEARDFFARILQHEIDHLDGMLLIDRVDFNQRQELLHQYQAL